MDKEQDIINNAFADHGIEAIERYRHAGYEVIKFSDGKYEVEMVRKMPGRLWKLRGDIVPDWMLKSKGEQYIKTLELAIGVMAIKQNQD